MYRPSLAILFPLFRDSFPLSFIESTCDFDVTPSCSTKPLDLYELFWFGCFLVFFVFLFLGGFFFFFVVVGLGGLVAADKGCAPTCRTYISLVSFPSPPYVLLIHLFPEDMSEPLCRKKKFLSVIRRNPPHNSEPPRLCPSFPLVCPKPKDIPRKFFFN